MNLFQSGDFTLHSGERSALKIECDALTTADWETLAAMVAARIPFRFAVGVPKGGMGFARALLRHEDRRRDDLPVLIVDDVLTTGASMEETRASMFTGPTVGVVVFARRECPDWIRPIFRMW